MSQNEGLEGLPVAAARPPCGDASSGAAPSLGESDLNATTYVTTITLYCNGRQNGQWVASKAGEFEAHTRELFAKSVRRFPDDHWRLVHFRAFSEKVVAEHLGRAVQS